MMTNSNTTLTFARAKKMLCNKKIYVGNFPELSRVIQQKLFDAGLRWQSATDDTRDVPKYTSELFLYTTHDGTILYNSDLYYFVHDVDRQELSIADVLRLIMLDE